MGFFCNVYESAYAKAFWIKQILGRLSNERYPTYLIGEASVLLPPRYWVQVYGMLDLPLNMACGQGVELNRVSLESLKERETLHHLSLTQQNTTQVLPQLGEILSFLLSNFNEMKKKLFKSCLLPYLADMAKFCHNGD